MDQNDIQCLTKSESSGEDGIVLEKR